jgi:lysozyme
VAAPNARGIALTVASVISIAAAMAATFEGHRTQPYRDVTGIPTVCYGHTGNDIQHRAYTPEECKQFLHDDMLEASRVVHRCIIRQMPVNVEAALTDFAFNIGPGRVGIRPDHKDGKDGLCTLKDGRKSQIRILANAGNWHGVCNQFQYWASAGGKRLAGLVRRRQAEYTLCVSP